MKKLVRNLICLRLKYIINRETLNKLYKSLIRPLMEYGDVFGMVVQMVKATSSSLWNMKRLKL
jgi:hypothetical protein